MRAAAILVALLCGTALLRADDQTVLFDDQANFGSFKTFTLRAGTVTAARPELKSPVLLDKLATAIRVALAAKGLKESADQPDLFVEYGLTAVDFSIGPFGRANPIRPGQRGPSVPVDFTEAALILDMKKDASSPLLWRGVYRDNESSASKLAEELPKNAAKLLAHYPPKKAK